MALERRELRDDLVAMIAAGREIPAENDYALADVFLMHARQEVLRDSKRPTPPIMGGHIAAFISGGLLALSMLLSPFLLFHRHHPGAFNRMVIVERQFDSDHRFDHPGR